MRKNVILLTMALFSLVLFAIPLVQGGGDNGLRVEAITPDNNQYNTSMSQSITVYDVTTGARVSPDNLSCDGSVYEHDTTSRTLSCTTTDTAAVGSSTLVSYNSSCTPHQGVYTVRAYCTTTNSTNATLGGVTSDTVSAVSDVSLSTDTLVWTCPTT